MSNPIQDVIDHFGGQKAAADALGVKQPTLSHSLEVGYLSAEVALKAQRATGGKFLALDLRPSMREHFSVIEVA